MAPTRRICSPSRGVMPFHVPHTFSHDSNCRTRVSVIAQTHSEQPEQRGSGCEERTPSPLKSAYWRALVWSLAQRSQMLVMRRESKNFQASTEGMTGYFQ